MSDPWARTPAGPAPIACPVCGTSNDAARQFCRKCASALRPGSLPPPVEEPARRVSPLLLGLVAAAVVLALAAVAAFALLGGPGAGASPSAGPATPAVTAPATPGTPGSPTPGPATTAPEPTPPPTTGPPTVPTILSFEAPRRANCSDPGFPGTIRLTWEVVAAEGVTLSIDGTGVYQSYTGTTGSDDVPFACGDAEHVYLLRTTGGVGPPDSERVVVRRR